MADDDLPKSWWQTLPGILTGLAATVTALGGLVIAINQTDWFSRAEPAAMSEAAAVTDTASSAAVTTPQRATATADTQLDSATADTPSSNPAATSKPSSNAATVTLPALRAYTFSDVEFTLLDAALISRNTGSSTLTIQVRLLNSGSYSVNFWDSQFRLLVDGIPRAPNSGLNVVVEGNAADEGEVRFIVPKSATRAQLRILFADEKADIPLSFVHGN